MSNSQKLRDDIKKHNGTAWAKAWLEESENELKSDAADALAYSIQNLRKEWAKTVEASPKIWRVPIIGDVSDGIHHPINMVYSQKNRKDTEEAMRECSHTLNKKYLLTSHYYKCEKCGKEFDNI